MRLKFVETKNEPIGRVVEVESDVYEIYVNKNLASYKLGIRNLMMSYVHENDEVVVSVNTGADVIKMLMQYKIRLMVEK